MHGSSNRINKLSVIINTEDDEKFIAGAVDCASFADEVLVVDCNSADKTRGNAEELGTWGRSGLAGFRGTKEQGG